MGYLEYSEERFFDLDNGSRTNIGLEILGEARRWLNRLGKGERIGFLNYLLIRLKGKKGL